MANRQTLVDAAVAWLGKNEADGSHREIVDVYNSIRPLPVGYKVSYTDAWCATFVSAVAKKAGLLDIVFAECGCERMIALYKNAGRWREDENYTPQKGDIIFYDWGDGGKGDNTGWADHVGIVVSVGSKNIKVIEGNISNKVGYRTIEINGKNIRGYGLPNYGDEAAPEVNDTEAETVSIKIPQYKKGATGNGVKALQLLLIGNGVSCGYAGADGEFGSMTEKAVNTWQTKKGLPNTGIADEATWKTFFN